MVRTAAATSLRAGGWTVSTGLSASRRLLEVARHPSRAGVLAEDLRLAASALTQALVPVETGDDRHAARQRVVHTLAANPVVRIVTGTIDPTLAASEGHQHGDHHPAAGHLPRAPWRPAVTPADPREALHAAGRELLRRSRDVREQDAAHPAYARIVTDLTPDETRILLLLTHQGPQPVVDVRTGGIVGSLSSTLVRGRLNMIGPRAGLRYTNRVPSYLNNLERLGLVAFADELVADPEAYQVLEAQPDVLAAVGEVRRARCVRRRLELTPFGSDFCRDGLGFDLDDTLGTTEQ